MKDIEVAKPKSYAIEDSDSENVDNATEHIKQILDAKYEPADLELLMKECQHLSKAEQHQLLQLLKKYDNLFDGTLGY